MHHIVVAICSLQGVRWFVRGYGTVDATIQVSTVALTQMELGQAICDLCFRSTLHVFCVGHACGNKALPEL